MKNPYIPLNLSTQGKPALVVGGGTIALRKIEWLLSFGTLVEVLTNETNKELTLLIEKNKNLSLRQEKYSSQSLAAYFMVIAATNNNDLNKIIAKDASNSKTLVNVVDNPSLSSFIVPATINRNPMTISICSGGNSPSLSSKIKQFLEGLLPLWLSPFSLALGNIRQRLKTTCKDKTQRFEINKKLSSIYSGQKMSSFSQSQMEKKLWENALELQKKDSEKNAAKSKKTLVWLVGAGPGDPGLLTLKGLQCLSTADVIIHDRLINLTLLNYAKPGCEIIDVGKAAGCHKISQDEINLLLFRKANEYKNVCRLKGGDPFVFARGAEEALFLRKRGVNFEIVPGVTSAIAVLAYAGIPVTHRDYASSFQVITGHENLNKTNSRICWKNTATYKGTLVFLMGTKRMQTIAQKLIQNGKDPLTPCAIISKGTLPEQQIVQTTLEKLSESAFPPTPGPTLIAVGETVSFSKILNWYNQEKFLPAKECS